MKRALSVLVTLGLGMLAACGSSGSNTPVTVTVLGYTVVITAAPPATAQVGAAVAIAFKVTENESDGSSKPASGKSITVAVTAGGGTIAGSGSTVLTTGADGSVATTWILGSSPGTQTIRGSVSATEFLDVNVTATAPPATQIVLGTQPSATATAGVSLARQPTVQLKDASGNNVAQAGVTVTASIATGGGTLAGTTAVATDASGLATFTNLAVNGVSGTVTLAFAATLGSGAVQAVSQGIAVAPPPPTQLAMATQPSASSVAGVAFAQQPAVQLKDANGNNSATPGIPVTATISNGGGTLAGTVTVNSDPTGLATFSNLAVSGVVGTVTLTFTATLNGAPVGVVAQAIAVTAPPATQLVIATQPSASAVVGIALAQQPTVQLKDANGNNVAQGGVPVTVSVASGGGSVAGTLTVSTDASGLASFAGLSLSGVTGSVTLRFGATLSGAAVSVTSAAINVLPAVTSVVVTGSLRVKVGDSYSYTATAKLADGTVVQRPLAWSVLVPGTATITSNGVLVPLQTGTISIIATIDGVPWVATTTGYDWVFTNFGTGIGVSLVSDDSFIDFFGNPEFPSLLISCGTSGTFAVGVGFPQMITNDGLVTYGGDNGILTSQTWLESSPTFHVLVYPGLTNLLQKSFAIALATNHTFVFAFDEFLNGSHADSWRLTGMSAAIAPILAACPSNAILAGAPSAPSAIVRALSEVVLPAGASEQGTAVQARRAATASTNTIFPVVQPALRAPDVIVMRILHP